MGVTVLPSTVVLIFVIIFILVESKTEINKTSKKFINTIKTRLSCTHGKHSFTN